MAAAALVLVGHHRVLAGLLGTANPMVSSLPTGPTRFAYVFYAANDPYGCSALVNMARLRRLGGGCLRTWTSS